MTLELDTPQGVTDMPCAGDAGGSVGIDRIIDEQLVSVVFQPIVDLATGSAVGFEALTRGPIDHPLHRPEKLFAAAGEVGRIGELDQVCREIAFDEMRRHGLAKPWLLFHNFEPAGTSWFLQNREQIFLRRGPTMNSEYPTVLEITERDLADNPFGLLRLVAVARQAGCLIALDDVGANPASLAFLPLLRPDVIKLDLKLVQQRHDNELAEILSAVTANVERSGAVLLAEGIETEQHLAVAVGLGAKLGQGYYFGRPAPLPESTTRPSSTRIKIAHRHIPSPDTPFDAVRSSSAINVSPKPLLLAMTRMLEKRALDLGESAVIFSTLQHSKYLSATTRAQYNRLGRATAAAVLLGTNLRPHPGNAYTCVDLHPLDALTREWVVAVVAPHHAAALIARDRGDTTPDNQRRFDYVLTHDRTRVLAAIEPLLTRMSQQQDHRRDQQTPPRHGSCYRSGRHRLRLQDL